MFFYKLFYKFPNELEWDTSPWYNFRHKVNNLKSFSYFEDGIFIVGSSVALYSALPKDIEAQLNIHTKDNRQFRVEFFSHVAMSPVDFYYYLDELIAKEPKLVAYLLNPGDFQFDSFLFDKEENFLGFNSSHWYKEYVNRYPTKYIYPGTFLLDNWSQLNKEEIFSLLTKQILHVNRVRLFFFDPISAFIERHYRKGKSYHNYTGITPNEGIYLKGWTKQSFTINCEVDFLDDWIYSEISDNELTITYQNKSKTFHLKKGWNPIQMQLDPNEVTKFLQFYSSQIVSSKIIDPKSYAKEKYYGIRLSQNFCKKDIEKNISYIRPRSLEDEELYKMSLEEYKEDYYNRLFKDSPKRPELTRSLHFHKVKKALSKRDFQTWKEWDYLKKIKDKLNKKGIVLIIINNPESSLERDVYANDKWYSGYISELRKYEDEVNTFFYDLSSEIKEDRLFLDSHHLTYLGAMQMTSLYAEIFRRHIFY